MRVVYGLMMLLPLLVPADALAQSGKIAGRVTDAASGQGLPGVNVVIEGGMQGGVSDAEGYYAVINVRPGAYTLRASSVGYTAEVVEGVRVRADLTTRVAFALHPAVLEGREIVVTAEQPIVQPDVSANVAAIDPEAYADLPVAGIDEVIDLQAGIEPGLAIRGGEAGEVAFLLDGMNLRTGRHQEPLTNVAFTSLEAVQVQTGGFNAEYGNVRAGLVHVTTKDPPRARYTFDGLFRLAPPQARARNALGALPADLADCGYGAGVVLPPCDTWIRPQLDPAVAFEGTDAWDPYTQRQYQQNFEGWNRIAERLTNNEGFDVTPQDLHDFAVYAHRKDNTVDDPDFEADLTLGGPLWPGLGRRAGDLRFLVSYRGTQTPYVIPQSRDVYRSDTYQGRLVAAPSPGMRLAVSALVTDERAMNVETWAAEAIAHTGRVARYPWGANVPGGLMGEYTDYRFNRVDVDHAMLGARFTHTVGAKTFYEIQVQNVASRYRSPLPQMRDGTFLCPADGVGSDGEACAPGTVTPVLYTRAGHVLPAYRDRIGVDRDGDGHLDVMCFGGTRDLNGDGERRSYCVGEEPFGYTLRLLNGTLLGGTVGSGTLSETRDTTDVAVLSARFDLTSQVNRFWQVKTGAELIASDLDVRWRTDMGAGVTRGESRWQRSPIQGAAYAQSKLEFQGMIANLGLRLDYFDPNTAWWVFDGPYDERLRGGQDDLDTVLETVAVDPQLYLSPRLGVSFPITERSKIYFNYGHFRQQLEPLDLFGIVSTPAGGVNELGDPSHPMPRTVAYELGFDRNLVDRYMLRVSAFYRDIHDQPRPVTFESLGGLVHYASRRPWNYEDIRGFELSLNKMRGRFLSGFLNYTFLQTKTGHFGYAAFFENAADMQAYLRTSTDYRLSAPLASPYGRANVVLRTPGAWGRLWGGWRAGLLGEWRQGTRFVWGGGGAPAPELRENVRHRSFRTAAFRLTKYVGLPVGDLQLFLDVDNVFNRKHVYMDAAFNSERDVQEYYWSLHLPEDTFDDLNTVDADASFAEKVASGRLPYPWIPGDDRPGDFRDPAVPFQPMEAVASLAVVANPNAVAWYWAADTGAYARWTGSAWEPVPQDELREALANKAYIDMPNRRHTTFLNPRRFTLGLRITI